MGWALGRKESVPGKVLSGEKRSYCAEKKGELKKGEVKKRGEKKTGIHQPLLVTPQRRCLGRFGLERKCGQGTAQGGKSTAYR